jgi:N-carbamoyl-L-amino-acid hydrolase
MDDLTRALDAVASAVDEDRHWAQHMEMAKIGATPRGGVNRQALTPEEARARTLLAGRAEDIGCDILLDDIGNMFICRPGTDPDADPVVSGSHLDSQPSGGRFDGTYGVLAAFEVLQALEAAGIRTRRPIEAVAWTNEEGGRFIPSMMGSYVYIKPDALEPMLAIEDAAGISIATALAETREATPKAGHRALCTPFAAYIENHIEQGPQLEDSGDVVAVVTGIQGTRKFGVEIVGEDAHAGTTPRRRRRDAVLAATVMIQAIERLMADPDDVLRCTFGRIDVTPNAPAVVPGRVFFTIDFRHPDNAVLRCLGDQVEPLCRALAGPCDVTVEESVAADSLDFAGPAVDAIRAAVERLGVPAMDIYSGAGHDARHMFRHCPTGMIFVPCEKGISHNEAENAKSSDLAAGTRVLAQALVELAGV